MTVIRRGRRIQIGRWPVVRRRRIGAGTWCVLLVSSTTAPRSRMVRQRLKQHPMPKKVATPSADGGGWDLGPPSSAAVGVGGASAGAPARLSDQREAAGFVQALTNSDTDGKYPLSIRSDGGGAMGRLGRLAASSSRPMNFVSPKFHQLSGDSR